ncbi:MAG: extracellular solute-binding protein [Bacilli bacterium]|nr:extracellular solute-binding protein [Bacilli bacterium]
MNIKNTRLLLLPLAALLAGCSSGGGTSSEPSASSSTPSGSGSASSSVASSGEIPDEVSVSFWSTGSQGMTTQLQTLASDFEAAIKKNTGKTVHMNVTVEGSYSDIEDKISKGLSVGNVPTMAVAYPDTVANILAKEADKEYLFDITPYMNDPEIGFTKQSYLGDTKAAKASDIVAAFFDEGTHYAREGMFSYPFMKSSEVMFYNVDDVERAYKYYKPEVLGKENIRQDLLNMSWEDFEELLTSVMEHKDQILNTLQHACWYDSDSNWFISQMYQRSIPYTDIVDNKGVIAFESGDNRTAAETMVTGFKKLFDDGRITTKGIENTYGSTAFTNGEVLFEIGSSGGTGYNMPEGVDPSKIGVVPVPAAKGNPSYVSQGPTITFIKNPALSEAENKAQMFYAWQFAKYLTNPANNVRLCIRGSEGYIPVRYSAFESADYLEFLDEESIYSSSAKVLIDEISGHYYNAPVFPGSAQLRDAMGNVIPYVLTGEKTAAKAIQDGIDYAKTFMK